VSNLDVDVAGLGAAVRGLVRRRHRRLQAVAGASSQIAPGEVVGLVGRNGAGKTTTRKMLSGLLYPTAVRVSVSATSPGRRGRLTAFLVAATRWLWRTALRRYSGGSASGLWTRGAADRALGYAPPPEGPVREPGGEGRPRRPGRPMMRRLVASAAAVGRVRRTATTRRLRAGTT
jgi:energy-coupling factor transporter ATP-binding protein EcfA2